MKNLKIAYQGVRGAYSYLAAQNVFPDSHLIGLDTFEEVFESVEQGINDVAFVPVRNSFAGEVEESSTYLKYINLIKIGEYNFNINHQLWGISGSKLSDIELVYSHPQALAQCRLFIETHKLNICKYTDTALACKKILELNNNRCAAIASNAAGEIYGLIKLANNIESAKNNVTTFFIFRSEKTEIE